MEEKIADQTADYMMMIPENTLFDISSSSCVEQREADDCYVKECSLGFTDTLTSQYFNTISSSLFDDLLKNNHHLPSIPVMSDDDHQPPPLNDTVNTPLTPNSSSSVSSLSDETAAADHDGHRKKSTVVVEEEAAEEEQDQEMTKKELKPKKKNQKKQKQPRFAFMTKTEVDNLDDGYRWRKYGQKAVKNSPFPRSYYRCTSTACGVKKRVERSCEDPTTVVTTYEGTHTHPCPITPRGTTFGLFPAGRGGGLAQFMIPQMMFHHHQTIHDEQAMINQQEKQHHHQSYLHNLVTCSLSSNLNVRSISSRNPTLFDRGERLLWAPSASNSLVITADNNGLLQDMLPSQILLKEPKEE